MKIRQVQCTRRVPKCLLFYLRRAFPIARFYSLPYALHNILPLPLSRTHTHAQHAHALIFPLAVMSSPLYVRRLWLRSSSNTQQSGRCQGQVGVTLVRNKRDEDKLELGYGAALDDGSCQRHAPSLSILDHFKYEPNNRRNKLWCQWLLSCLCFGFAMTPFLLSYLKRVSKQCGGDVVSMLCYTAVHFQHITEVIILKWLQLVICQTHFTFSWWPADKCLRVRQKINNRGIP